ncbi:hypothetical protein ACFQAS_02095 [Halopenitus salinus]|uniref:MalT-like winged helix domain-containing protein n=1 Tax=Halopenitus salinus TaxID=1198295 RepID=A0ABD5UR68_9EURY
MDVSSPFVNRTTEMNRLQSGLGPESNAQMYTVSGPSGFGKSALLDEFASTCESENIPVIRYEIGNPDTVQVFLQRLLEEWEAEFPNSVREKIKSEVSPSTIKSISSASSILDPSGGVGSAVLGTTLAKLFNTDDDITETIDPIHFVLDVIRKESENHDQIVLIIDQYDVGGLNENRKKKFNSAFQEISRDLPDNVTWYIGSSRHIPNEPENILRVGLSELDDHATEELVQKHGFSVEDDVIGEVYNRTRGHPFILNKLLTLADNTGLKNILNDSPLNRPELINYLEDSLLNELTVEEEQLLRDSCVLRELRPHILSEMTDRSQAKVRQLLAGLHQRAIVKRREEAGEWVYRCHDLQRDYILDNESSREKRKNRMNAARAFLIHGGEFWNNTQMSESGRETQDYTLYLGHMMNFDFQLEKITDTHDIGFCIDQILSNVNSIEKEQAINAIEHYYSTNLSYESNLDTDAILGVIL